MVSIVFHGIVIVTTRIVNSTSLRKICRQVLSKMNVLKDIKECNYEKFYPRMHILILTRVFTNFHRSKLHYLVTYSFFPFSCRVYIGDV